MNENELIFKLKSKLTGIYHLNKSWSEKRRSRRIAVAFMALTHHLVVIDRVITIQTAVNQRLHQFAIYASEELSNLKRNANQVPPSSNSDKSG